MATANLRGQFVWHELLTTDPKAAVAFYTRIIGWNSKAWEHDPSYTILLANDQPVGGVMQLPEDAKAAGKSSFWLSYIRTPDVKATVETAVRFGGKLLKAPAPIPEVGLFAVVADPYGAPFAAFTPQMPMPVDDEPRPGAFSWHELATVDHVAAFNFYQELFGWEKTSSMDMGPSGLYQMFGWGSKGIGAMYNGAKDGSKPSSWLAYTVVPDSKRVAETVGQAGGKLVSGPMEIPGGDLIATCLDPQGAAFAVHSLAQVPAGRR